MDKIVVEIDRDLDYLIPGYLDNRRKDVFHIERCLREGDFTAIRRMAHRMKGSGGGYGFAGISDIGAAMELAAIQENSQEVQVQLRKLIDYLIRVEVIYV